MIESSYRELTSPNCKSTDLIVVHRYAKTYLLFIKKIHETNIQTLIHAFITKFVSYILHSQHKCNIMLINPIIIIMCHIYVFIIMINMSPLLLVCLEFFGNIQFFYYKTLVYSMLSDSLNFCWVYSHLSKNFNQQGFIYSEFRDKKICMQAYTKTFPDYNRSFHLCYIKINIQNFLRN